MKSSRALAFEVLCKIEKDDSYSNLALDSALSNHEASTKDSALATALVYGVLERKITLDYALSAFLDKGINRLKAEVLTALRIAAYQILYMDKVPHSAAVNESVKLIRGGRFAFAAGLVNAVLRRLSENGMKYPEKDNNILRYYSIMYSCPEALVKLWIEAYGEDTAKGIMEASNGYTPIIARVNTLKTDSKSLIKNLQDSGVFAKEIEYPPNAIELSGTGSIEKLPAFKSGLFHIQDISSQLCALSLGAKKGDTIFDLCSAPGSKSFTIAEIMENSGEIKAFDLHKHRTELIKIGAQRLGIDIIKAEVGDALIYNKDLGQVDCVLCDVPCSGLGIIRRKPEIRYKNLKNIDKLTDLQYLILSNAKKYVRTGGRLVYSTCALNPAENDAICDRFLAENTNFKLVPALQKGYSAEKYTTLFPHIHGCDGFFIAAFTKME